MKQNEHPLDKYILSTQAQLMALPAGNTQAYDTSQLQLMCLEKFANFQGYRIEGGLFVIDNPSARILTLDNMRSLYNNTMRYMGESLKGQAFIKKVYLAGRSLRKPVIVTQHWVSFL
jgi:hypothetical protein